MCFIPVNYVQWNVVMHQNMFVNKYNFNQLLFQHLFIFYQQHINKTRRESSIDISAGTSIEDAVYEMASILSRPQCVKRVSHLHQSIDLLFVIQLT